MQTDLKIGMVLGLVLTIAAMVWLSTRPSLSTKARMLNSYNGGAQQESIEQPLSSAIAGSPDVSVRRDNLNTLLTSTTTKAGTEQSNDITINKEAGKITHTILEGETLSGISREYYGSENKWRKILAANRNVVKDANKLRPGTKLIIPE
jgi:nucleoid-associated protein YgaU